MNRLVLLVVFVLVLVACEKQEEVIQKTTVPDEIEVTRIVVVTKEVKVTRVVEILKEVVVIATPTPIPPTPTPESTPTPEATSTLVPTPTSATTARVEQGVNLHSGPGTDYPIVGSLKAGDSVEVIASTESGEWYQIARDTDQQVWVASRLLVDAPGKETLAIAQNIPTPPPATPVPEQSPSTTLVSPESRFRSIGEEIEGGGWRFNVKEVHKRKAVYFYGKSYIAQGLFLVVIIDAVNLQSGTDYFARNIDPYVTEFPGTRGWRQSSTATSYAQWQFEGVSSTFTDVNPGVFIRMAMAFDLPTEMERVLLSTETLEWVDLGIFNALPLEE